MSNYLDDVRPGGRPQPITQTLNETKQKVRKTLIDDAPIEEKQIIDDTILESTPMGNNILKIAVISWIIMECC